MLANSNLKYISQNYNNLSKIYDQINTGKKITKPSDDPVIAMKGMRYRSQLVEVDQFRRNLSEGFNWLDNADATLDETNQVLNRIRDLTVQASNDSYDPIARKNIAEEITSLQEHIIALANTRVGENYIFNGTDTDKSPIDSSKFNMDFNAFVGEFTNNPEKAKDYIISYKGQVYKSGGTDENGTTVYTLEPMVEMKDKDAPVTEPPTMMKVPTAEIRIGADGKVTHIAREANAERNGEIQETNAIISSNDLVVSNKNAASTNNEQVKIEVMKGVSIPINLRGQNAFSTELFGGLESLKKMLTDPATTGKEITKALDTIDGFLNDIVSTRAELGAQTNRAEMVDSRLMQQKVIATQTVSNNEDIDFEEAIMNFTIQESLHKASLAVGARIIQPTLMDFLR